MVYYKNTITGKTYTSETAAKRSGGSVVVVSSPEKYPTQAFTLASTKTRVLKQQASNAKQAYAQQMYDSLISKQMTAQTKAEQRLENQKATQAVNVNVDSNLSNPQPIPTAWQQIAKRQASGNWFTNLYDKIDYGFYGFLPSGLSRTLVKAADTENKIPQIQALTKAQQRKSQAETEKDYSTNSWYENIPFLKELFLDEQEKIYRLLQKNLEGQEALRNQRVNAIEGGYTMPLIVNTGGTPSLDLSSLGFDSGSTSSSLSDFGTYAKYGLLAIGAIMLISALKSK